MLFVYFELFFPFSEEFLELLITDIDILSKLVLLNISPQFILILVDIDFKKAHFFHKIFIKGIFLNIAEFFSQNLHFFFDA